MGWRELSRDPARGLATFDRAATLARTRGLVEVVSESYLARTVAAIWMSRDDIAEMFDDGLAYTRKQGDELHELYLLANRACFELDTGTVAGRSRVRRTRSRPPLGLDLPTHDRAYRPCAHPRPARRPERPPAHRGGALARRAHRRAQRIAPVAVAAAEVAWLIGDARAPGKQPNRRSSSRSSRGGPRHRQPAGVAQTAGHHRASSRPGGRGAYAGSSSSASSRQPRLPGKSSDDPTRPRSPSPTWEPRPLSGARSGCSPASTLGQPQPSSPAACAHSAHERSRAARGHDTRQPGRVDRPRTRDSGAPRSTGSATPRLRSDSSSPNAQSKSTSPQSCASSARAAAPPPSPKRSNSACSKPRSSSVHLPPANAPND